MPPLIAKKLTDQLGKIAICFFIQKISNAFTAYCNLGNAHVSFTLEPNILVIFHELASHN